MFVFLSKYFVPAFAGLFLLGLGCATHAPRLSSSLIIQNGNISQEMSALFAVTGLEQPKDIAQAIEQTQANWLRRPGKERWEMERKFKFDGATKNRLASSFKNLLLTPEIIPQHEHYDYALILGATAKSMRTRFAYFIKLWNRGVRVDSVIFLVGQREIAPIVETPELILGRYKHDLLILDSWQAPMLLPRNETEVARLIVDQAILPPGLTTNMISFVDTPMQKRAMGQLERPNTTDTVELWLTQDIKARPTVLAISSNPIVGYQHAALVRALPSDFIVETVGSAASNPEDFELIFDSLARWLYQYRPLST